MIPLRLVVDTNIVVSAALKPEGLQRTVLLLAITKPGRLYVSAAIIAEYRDVLSRPELQIRKGLGYRTTGAGNRGTEQAFGAVQGIVRMRIFAIG